MIKMYSSEISDLDSMLRIVKEMVEETVVEIMNSLMNEMNMYSSELLDIAYSAKDFILRGGKRIRPLLVLLGYWSREWGLQNPNIKYLVSSVEFLHNYLLIHDDIMDRDVVRRGGPTIHVLFRNKCIERSMVDCDHYGVSQAITIGDYLEALAVNMFSKLELPGDILRKLLQTYTRGLRLVAYGQYLDVLTSQLPLRSISEKHVVTVHILKTASYTVELPLHIGAIASGGDENLLRDLSAYAIPAGLAFQLVDDVLGLFGDEKVTGKPADSDVKEKKKTLLIVKAYELASNGDREFLEEIYDRRGSRDISLSDVEKVRKIVVESGSLDYVKKRIAEEAGKARKAIESSSSINVKAKNILTELLDLIISREK